MAVLNVTKLWVSKAITSSALYGRALCPFAKKVVDSTPSRLKISVSSSVNEDDLLAEVKSELNSLFPPDPSTVQHHTTLLVAPNLFQNNYRSMIHFSWKIMEAINSDARYQQKLQVVTFHPAAVTSLLAMDAPAEAFEYALRAPHPTFHLLREEDILDVVQNSNYPQPELIPYRNAALLRELGADECEQRFKSLLSEAEADTTKLENK